MSKRGRTSSVTGRQDDDGESSDLIDFCSYVYDILRNHKKEDGSLLCDTFIRVPKRRQDPSYYEVVSNPIDMLKIQQKIKTDDYEDIEDMAQDVELMVNNAKSFYKKNSTEYKDAVELMEMFNSIKNRLLESEDQSSVESDKKGKIILKVGKLARKAAAAAEAKKQDPDDTTSEGSSVMEEESNQIEELFTAVMQATDGEKRQLNSAFMLLPSKKKYPEYYDIIDNPIDLKQIARKIQANQYNHINDLEKDMLLMTKNACSFNEPGSQIYKDAKTLKKIIVSKKFDIVHGKLKAKVGSRSYQPLSAITAALKEEATSEEEELEGDSDVDLDNPRWQLYDVVKNTTNNGGYALCEPFWKLPSRRHYPDYYKEIKNPVSLLQIRNKLKKGEYGTVSEVAGDLNIMFENAKKYNRPESRLYRDAIKLQKVMQHKVKELLDFDQESESDTDSDNSPIIKKDTSPIAKKRGRKSAAFIRDNPSLRKRFLSICKALTEYTYEDGRQPILMFMEKPSKKLYPEYYKIIAEPIDLLQIQGNIKAEKYTTEDQLISDLKLMFSNCRKFNEENSVIYKDANNLEKVLNDKLKELGPLPDVSTTPKKSAVKAYKPRRKQTQADAKLRSLFETIKEFRDSKGRHLSLVFAKLPSRIDYPDYYEVIKKPIDLDKIGSKLKGGHYETLDDLVTDLILMLDNACKFNEPDSQIYKDALQLQRVVLQTKLQLREDENLVPDVKAAVQELLTSLFTSVYNHQDEEGRCFSDCMLELPEHDEIEGKKVRGISLDIVKRRLDKGLYKRLDRFQEDLFACLERARKLSRTDSQVFEDSIELQAFYIRQRDELCRGGDILNSPALNYNLLHLSAAVEQQKQQKLLKETPSEEENEGRNPEDPANNTSIVSNNSVENSAPGGAMIFNQQHYHVGDFVYIQPQDRNAEPSIIHILRGWTNAEGIQMLYGDCFCRPNETYHVQTRKFLEKEVFKSDQHVAVPLSQVLGRCCVMSVKDYFKLKPEGFDEKDIYVCESRYSSKARAFKKIKVWPFSTERLTLIPREEPFEPKRIMCVFKDRLEKHITEIAELEEYEKLEEKEKPNIQLMNMPPNPEITAYYQQLNLPWGAIKTGDFVYIETENNTRLAAQVDTIWANKDGECFIKGPWFLRPQEIFYIPGRTFYKQEMFLGCLEDVHSIQNVVGRCCVMEHTEYISCRPTEIEEKDIYICQSIYNEQRRQLTKLVNGLKRYTHSDTVTQDEIYFFRRLINPLKVSSESIALHTMPDTRPVPLQVQNPISGYETPSESNMITQKVDQDILSLMEDSLDGGPPSVGSGDIPAQSPLPAMQTPLSLGKKKGKEKNPAKLVTGYILYSSEIRKGICTSHPEASFGEISRMVGNEWRQLTAEVKQSWEEKAAKMNEEMKEAKALEEAMYPQGVPPATTPNPANLPLNFTFECAWDNCDYQFDDLNDCLEHAVAEGSGHVQMYFAAVPPSECEWQCQWKGCNRIKKNCPPFPSLTRLARHVKEVHIMKSNGKVIQPSERSKNYIPSKRAAVQRTQQVQIPQAQYFIGVSGQTGSSIVSHHLLSLDSPNPSVNSTIAQLNQKPADPIFVTVPPRPQRLLHSDAYIKYIEGLSSDSKYISSWDRMLKATQENTPPVDESRLPGYWLANGPGNYGTITNALWALRDFMLRDALNISKIL
ncbi:predicted protein [Pediculus humanus corporis]|uniref:Predicted protein n=1 Tax=Pediculus humanus subsp. corporis TaxID=121224 RepID=E0VJE8_PEDHC|nr:uncharacterized protein Phum_PHUM244090 [Pediculus humanus corporis]EEB13504.1 predicted protein [Pediculus humanus corporis]